MLKMKIMELLKELAIYFPAFLLIFSVRGFFKAWFAKLAGDNTAQEEGFLTLNPIMHIDFLGFTLMLFFVFFVGGLLAGGDNRGLIYMALILIGSRWIHQTPIEENNFKRHSSGVALTTLAGTIGNSLLVLVILYLIKYWPHTLLPHSFTTSLMQILTQVVYMGCFFAVFDLIPIPPFNGGRLLEFIFPKKYDSITAWCEQYSLFIFLVLFCLPIVSDFFFMTVGILSILLKNLLTTLVF